MRVERDHRPVAEAVSHDQIGGAKHPDGLDGRARHRVRLDLEAELLKQFARPRAMRRAIAGRIVARHFHKLGQEGGFARELRVDEPLDLFAEGHGLQLAWRAGAASGDFSRLT